GAMADEVTEANLPFGMGKIDLSSPMVAVVGIVSMILGWAVFSMTQDIGSYVGSRVNSALGNVLGFNPATGNDSEADLV
ncbi:MAG: hypothetical protein ABEH58_00800, partial [Haloplanus sp.]